MVLNCSNSSIAADQWVLAPLAFETILSGVTQLRWVFFQMLSRFVRLQSHLEENTSQESSKPVICRIAYSELTEDAEVAALVSINISS